jgi:hypothetical protein
MHLCVHGMSWETVPPIRWILDVHLLLQAHRLDWERVVAEAHRRGVTLPLAEALAIYETVLQGEIPAWIRRELKWLDPTEEQRLAYAGIVTEPSTSTVFRGWVRVWRTAKDEGQVKPGLSGMVRFLCLRWRVESVWRLPAQFHRRFRRRWRSVRLFQ